MAEGLADLGVQAAIGDGWGPWAAEVLGDLGLHFDGHLAERVAAAAAPLNRVRQDAAVLLHDRGASTDEVAAFIQRWSLVSGDRARQQLRFLTHPLWRAYTTTYVEDRKSTRLNSSHANISYAVFCLKKKKNIDTHHSLSPTLRNSSLPHPSLSIVPPWTSHRLLRPVLPQSHDDSNISASRSDTRTSC